VTEVSPRPDHTAHSLFEGTDFDLSGKVALITGAAQGLGLEMALGFAAAGATVLINARPGSANLETANARLAAAGKGGVLPFDITDIGAIDAALLVLAREWGGLDILVNNAGSRFRGGIWEVRQDNFFPLIDVNLFAPFHLARSVGRLMREQARGGRIINISSIAAHIPTPLDPAYAASKAALEVMTKILATEFGPDGITVNAIAPGPFLTEYNARSIGSTGDRAVRKRTILGRWGNPSEIIGPALLLASNAGSYITATTLMVDGGYSRNI